ncbi:MAG: thermonuclease family protein, partial [Verrucomicrobiales bacterium]|nr:thermonuclease family protein [Verrucomicrobiales bacterium]
MFWFLHYTVKAVIALAFLALGLGAWMNRHRLEPAEEWVQTLRRAEVERLEVLGTNTAMMVRAPSGDTVTVGQAKKDRLVFRVAGVVGPPRALKRHSPAWKTFERSREHLQSLALSNEVTVAYTFFEPRVGGVGAVYLRGTNLALAQVAAGMALVHDASLKGLPLPDQVKLLAEEKKAREEKRGFWAEPEVVARIREAANQTAPA